MCVCVCHEWPATCRAAAAAAAAADLHLGLDTSQCPVQRCERGSAHIFPLFFAFGVTERERARHISAATDS